MVRVPALFEKLDSASRSLFLQLIERATEPAAVLSSREQRAISREIAAALVLLCHKRRCRFTELQWGQCPRTFARATLRCKRNVVIEFDT